MSNAEEVAGVMQRWTWYTSAEIAELSERSTARAHDALGAAFAAKLVNRRQIEGSSGKMIWAWCLA